MNDQKPKKLHSYKEDNGDEKAIYRVVTTPLHHKLRNGLVRHGEFYFTANQFMDAIALAFEDADAKKAVEHVLTFNKWLKSLEMEWFHLGYALLPDDRLAFTYSVQSRRHYNAPLVVHEIVVPHSAPEGIAVVELSDAPSRASSLPSALDIRIYEAMNSTASTWISAYERRPGADILNVSNGL